MSNFCSNCGAQLNEHDNFCPRCGKKTSEQSASRRVKDNGIVENFLSRDGRLNRWRYFKRSFLLCVIESFVMLIGMLFLAGSDLTIISSAQSIYIKIIALAGLVPQFCLLVRRLHDMDKDDTLAYVFTAVDLLNIMTMDFSLDDQSAWENVLAIIMLLISLYVLFGRGTKGDNQYGADPLED